MEKTKSKSQTQKEQGSSGLMETWCAVCDTFLPSIEPSGTQEAQQAVAEFYRTSASMAGIPEQVAECANVKLQHPRTALARLAIRLLSTTIGTFILCGTNCLSPKFPFIQRFAKLPDHKREQILRSWAKSWFILLRIFYASLKFITILLFYTKVNERNENISWKAIGYCGPDPDHKARALENKDVQQPATDEGEQKDELSKEDLFGPLYRGIINLNHSQGAALQKLQNSGFPVTIPQSKSPLIGSLNPSFIVKCDAVVVGSGPGGAVVADVLAKAGHKVLVLEKGRYSARSNLSLLEGQSMEQMYLGNGMLAAEDMSVIFLAGSTVGGGSTINWSASIKTPPHVRKDWSEKHELGLFQSKAFDQALDIVCKKMEVQSEIKDQGFNNMVLMKGCDKLGYPIQTAPINAPSDHYCGWCCFGCKDGKKKGASETWLLDLVESRNGAILPNCEAIKVVTEEKQGRKRALGVLFAFLNEKGDREYAMVESKLTVSAAGAICTPPLLKRSGLKNPNIGKYLHVHPTVMAWGYFPDGPSTNPWPEKKKKSYEGGILTAMSKIGANFENSFYGGFIQTPSLHPGMFSAVTPWISGRDMKDRMLKFSRTVHIFALHRDVGSGIVNTENEISYNLHDADQKNMTRAMEKMLRLLAAAGAREIGTQRVEGRVLKMKEADNDEFERFVVEESRRSFKKLSAPICSAHQMGSCRMGVDPRRSAVDPKGETWEVEGLYVADTSVFPTAVGANPMVTAQAIAYCISQSMLEYLRGKET